jgi:hypothetical protein
MGLIAHKLRRISFFCMCFIYLPNLFSFLSVVHNVTLFTLYLQLFIILTTVSTHLKKLTFLFLSEKVLNPFSTCIKFLLLRYTSALTRDRHISHVLHFWYHWNILISVSKPLLFWVRTLANEEQLLHAACPHVRQNESLIILFVQFSRDFRGLAEFKQFQTK